MVKKNWSVLTFNYVCLFSCTQIAASIKYRAVVVFKLDFAVTNDNVPQSHYFCEKLMFLNVYNCFNIGSHWILKIKTSVLIYAFTINAKAYYGLFLLYLQFKKIPFVSK